MDRIMITKRQKKILMIVGIVGIAFIIFIAGIYLPMRRRLVTMKAEFSKIESEINEIRNLAGEQTSLENTIGHLKNRLDTLERKFPPKEEIILRELPDLAVKAGVEMTGFRPQRKRPIKDLDGVPINIKDCFAQEMPISISVKAPYKTLGEFFKALEEDFQIFVRVEKVRFGKAPDKAAGLLNADADLNTYLVCPIEK